MRRLVDWLGGALSGIALYRLWKRWLAEPEPAALGADPAEKLRAKLAESREAEPAPSPPDEPERPESPEERRRRVHEEGRAAIDEMHGE
jgi:hypothetical protein